MTQAERDERGMPKVPDTFTVITGEERQVDERQDKFFVEILDFLEYPEKARGIRTQVSDRFMVPTSWSKDHGTQTDDSITLLTIGDDRIIASVIRYRTEMNYIQAIFSHCLNPELVEIVRFKPIQD